MIKDILEIQLFMDGDKWCALVGRDLQEGIAGFGDTPVEAIEDLCLEFRLAPYNLKNITLQ